MQAKWRRPETVCRRPRRRGGASEQAEGRWAVPVTGWRAERKSYRCRLSFESLTTVVRDEVVGKPFAQRLHPLTRQHCLKTAG